MREVRILSRGHRVKGESAPLEGLMRGHARKPNGGKSR